MMPRVLGEIDELHFFLRYLLALSRDAEVWGRGGGVASMT